MAVNPPTAPVGTHTVTRGHQMHVLDSHGDAGNFFDKWILVTIRIDTNSYYMRRELYTHELLVDLGL
jgi:IS4 transposase